MRPDFPPAHAGINPAPPCSVRQAIARVVRRQELAKLAQSQPNESVLNSLSLDPYRGRISFLCAKQTGFAKAASNPSGFRPDVGRTERTVLPSQDLTNRFEQSIVVKRFVDKRLGSFLEGPQLVRLGVPS